MSRGGSGKTTTSAHLAQYLALRGYRVLAVDLDPQASLTALYGIQPELDDKASFYESLRYDEERKSITEIIQPTNSSQPRHRSGKPRIAGIRIRDANCDAAEGSECGKLFYTRVGDALAEVDDRYDVVVIDCPPQLGYLTLTALTAATSVLITVHPQMLDIMSMSQFLLMLGNILKSVEAVGVNVSLDWFRYLVTRYEPMDIPATADGWLHAVDVRGADDAKSNGQINGDL
ncbi:AAA family ATPase [Rhizobium beringeri]